MLQYPIMISGSDKLIKAACFAACLLYSMSASADVLDVISSNNQIMVQAMSTYVDYTETGNGRLGTRTGILDTETGHVPGFAFSLTKMKNTWFDNNYMRLEYNYSKGRTVYTGSYQGGVYGDVVSTSGATLTNYNVRYGKGFIAGWRVMLTPYLELGHHEWNRRVNYGEIYTHNYYGLGGLVQYSPILRLVLQAHAMVGNTFGSHIVVNSGGSMNGFSADLGNSAIYKYGLSVDYEIKKRLHANVGVDYTSFSYGISDVYPVGGGYVAWEPDSTTKFTMFRLGIGKEF